MPLQNIISHLTGATVFDIMYPNKQIDLIKSGGGIGPMKPGNLRRQGAKSGGDKDRKMRSFPCVPRRLEGVFCCSFICFRIYYYLFISRKDLLIWQSICLPPSP